MLRSKMVVDGDTGLLVDPNWYEPKHPQETPIIKTDAVALRRPAPEQSIPDGEGDPAPELSSFLPPP